MWAERYGKTWRIRDRLAGGRKITIASGYVTKTAAKAGITTLTADRLRGESLVPRGGRVLLADWIDAWLPSYTASLKPTSAISEPARVRRHIRPLLGGYALDDLEANPLIIQRWVGGLATGAPERRKLAPKTIRNTHALLHKIMQAAILQKLIRSNPCASTALPAKTHTEARFLTEPEIARLLAHTPEHWRPLVLLLVSTGLRWGEAIGLRVGRVDILASPPRLTVLEALHELSGTGELVFTEPKSRASRRTVTFPPSVAAELAELIIGKGRTELMFAAALGGPVRTRNFRRGWVKWTSAAGLSGLRIHDLRHTHAALLIAANVPLTGIQRRLGHSSIAVTSDLYGHLLPAVDAGILTAIDAALPQVRAWSATETLSSRARVADSPQRETSR
jgi:integrase